MNVRREDIPLLCSALAKFIALSPAACPDRPKKDLVFYQNLAKGLVAKLSMGVRDYTGQEIDALRIACSMGAFVLDGFTVQERARLSFYEDQFDAFAASLADAT